MVNIFHFLNNKWIFYPISRHSDIDLVHRLNKVSVTNRLSDETMADYATDMKNRRGSENWSEYTT